MSEMKVIQMEEGKSLQARIMRIENKETKTFQDQICLCSDDTAIVVSKSNAIDLVTQLKRKINHLI